MDRERPRHLAARMTAPWPADSLTRLIAADVIRINWKVTVTYSGPRIPGADPDTFIYPTLYDVPAESIDIVEDAASRPFATATVTVPARPFGATIPPDAWAGNTAQLWIHADYGWNGPLPPAAWPYNGVPGPPQFVFCGVIVGVEDSAAGQRITAHSVDARMDFPHVGDDTYTMESVENIPQAMTRLAAFSPEYNLQGVLYLPAAQEHPTRPPVADSNTLPAMRALQFGTGDNPADFLGTLVDCYPNAWTYPNREGLEATLYVAERITPSAANSVDARAGRGLVNAAPTIRWDADGDFGNVVRLTVSYTENGQDVTMTHETPSSRYMNNHGWGAGPTVKAVDVRRRVRPPGSTRESLEPLLAALVNRADTRTWTAVLQARPMLWLRPGAPIRITDTLYGVVTSIRLTHPAALMSLTVRPI